MQHQPLPACRRSAGASALAVLLALSACGGGGGSGTPPALEPATVGTVAYVDNECHEDARGASARQRLQILRGDRPPLTVAEIPTYGRLPAVGLCPVYGGVLNGSASVYALAFQRLGVSPDGSGVVFEVTFDFSLLNGLGVRNPLTPEQEGIFFVGADGKNRRRLGPASREAAQLIQGVPSASMPAVPSYAATNVSFSPDGRTITFTDRGPGPAGEDAAQVVTLDIATGIRTPVTHLPFTPPDPQNPALPAVNYSVFLDAKTIGFLSRANPADPTGKEPKGLNPEGKPIFFSVQTDTTNLHVLPLPALVPGGFVPSFHITGPVNNSTLFIFNGPGTPVNLAPFDLAPATKILEIFVSASDHTLQLTSFARVDTGFAYVTTDGQRVFFIASANPPDLHDSNPSETCQVFSIDTLGTDLRQLTHFGGAEPSAIGCRIGVLGQPGCFISDGPYLDPRTGALIFNSSCDLQGHNANGNQIFAMRPDGSGVRQLTVLRGVVAAEDGSVDVELPGPIAYPAIF